MEAPHPLFHINEVAEVEAVGHGLVEVKVITSEYGEGHTRAGESLGHGWFYRVNVGLNGGSLVPEKLMIKRFVPASVSYKQLIDYLNK